MSTYRPDREALVQPGQIDHHVADFTATFAADVKLRAASEALSAQKQWLAIDGDPEATLGELVQTNSTGPLRLGYGAWRDLLLGVQFHNGRGELITAVGRTVKNVAGYDLTKFMVGQRGVFGNLATLTTRTWKRPAGAILATFDAPAALMQELIPSPLKPQWSLLVPRDGATQLLCGYVGDERALAYYQSALEARKPASIQRRSVEQDIEHRFSLWKGEFRASVPPARVEEFLTIARPSAWAADPAFGIILGDGNDTALRQAAQKLSGTIAFHRGGKATSADWFDVPPGPLRQLLERLKEALDPDGRLAPLPWKLT